LKTLHVGLAGDFVVHKAQPTKSTERLTGRERAQRWWEAGVVGGACPNGLKKAALQTVHLSSPKWTEDAHRATALLPLKDWN
jgi:hypothetical protein